jgi:Tol biopolymer transport system component
VDADARVSPDGRLAWMRQGTGSGVTLLSNANDLLSFTARELENPMPAVVFSANSRYIAFLAAGELQVWDLQGGIEPSIARTASVGDPSAFTGFVSWSPTGDQIAAFLDQNDRLSALNLDFSSTDGPVAIATLGNGIPGNWSPDGSRLALAGGYIHNLRGGNVQLEVPPDAPGADVQLPDCPLAGLFSPDGHLALGCGSHIFIFDGAGTWQRTVSTGAAQATPLSWSADGSTLAYGESLQPNLGRIWVVGSGSGEIREIADLGGSSAAAIEWSVQP